MKPWGYGRLFVFMALASGIAGCQSEPAGHVTGQVTENGLPVPHVEVVFRPHGENTRSYYGSTTAQGDYRIDYEGREGLPPGDYTVTISRHTLPDGKPLPEGEVGTQLVDDGQAVTRTYLFEAQVVEGENPRDFELTRAKIPPGQNRR